MKRMVLKRITVNLLFLLALCMFLITSGCSGPKVSAMVPRDFELVNRHHSTVTLNESVGGKSGAGEITNSTFTEALGNALKKSGVFQGVIKRNDADYILDVTILKYSQPWIGITFDISMNAKWELTNAKTLVPVWSETFETTYHGKFSDSIVGAIRYRKAIEGSARENIREGIRRLSLLSL